MCDRHHDAHVGHDERDRHDMRATTPLGAGPSLPGAAEVGNMLVDDNAQKTETTQHVCHAHKVWVGEIGDAIRSYAGVTDGEHR